MWRIVKALTDVTIWSLLSRRRGDILTRSPAASGETSKRQMSSLSTSIAIEKPWRGHKLDFSETVLQAWNSRVNVWVRNKHTQCYKQARHTLAASSIISSLPWPDWSVKARVNDSCYYRNINIYIYLQVLWTQWEKNLDCHFLIIPHASIDCAKQTTPD